MGLGESVCVILLTSKIVYVLYIHCFLFSSSVLIYCREFLVIT